MHDSNNNDDGGHRTPLRWPPRVGRRQWKPRGGAQSNEHPGNSHPSAEPPLHEGSRNTPPHTPPHDTSSRDMSGGADRGPQARQPNERDEAPDKVGVPEVRTKQRKTIERAYEDVTSGRVDTDLRGHMHETYGRLRRKPDPTR